MKVDYRLSGKGWAHCTVEIAGQRAEVIASYLTDALDALLAATIAVVRGAEGATFSFAAEPEEVRWQLRRAGSERLRVRILRLEDSAHHLPDDQGEVLLDAECRLHTFAGQVLSSAQRVLAEHGTAGYRKEWRMHDFPLERMRSLEAALRI